MMVLSEVEHLDHARRRDHDVGGLQIAMDDVLFVSRFKSVGDLARVVECGIRRERSLECLTLHQFYDQRSIFDAVDLRDVGVIERGQYLGFARSAPDSL